MKQPDRSSLRDKLTTIRDHYAELRNISSLLLDEKALDNAGEIMQARSRVLASIEREEMTIAPILDGPDADEVYRLRHEIAALIRSQYDFDKVVMVKVKERMGSLRREMAGLYRSTGAARAYTAQSRIS